MYINDQGSLVITKEDLIGRIPSKFEVRKSIEHLVTEQEKLKRQIETLESRLQLLEG